MTAFPQTPMRVLLSNCTQAYALARKFGTDRIGHIYSPMATRNQDAVPYALDNGAFVSYKRSCGFDWIAFWDHLSWALSRPRPPLWVAVPDVVGNRAETLALWREHAEEIGAKSRFPLAFVVQDGMTPRDVPANHNVVFVGGSTVWKWRTVAMWCGEFARVHVGRVNRPEMLWRLQDLGAESCDGTGWFRGDKRQTAGLLRYLAQTQYQPALFDLRDEPPATGLWRPQEAMPL